jgi:hypothetical protein
LRALFGAGAVTVRAELAKHVKKNDAETRRADLRHCRCVGSARRGSMDGAGGGKWAERLPVQFEWLAATEFTESAVIAASFSKIGGKGSEVEADETFVGGVTRFKHARSSQADDY